MDRLVNAWRNKLLEFLSPDNRENVERFRKILDGCLRVQGQELNGEVIDENLFDDLLQLKQFDCMIPFRQLKRYIEIRCSKSGRGLRTSTGVVLDRLYLKMRRHGKPITDDQHWWDHIQD
jgi:hypothetical protein